MPWISYNWGPYGIGGNVLYAPGRPEDGWAYTEEGLNACVDFAAQSGRKIAGLVITCPDNPTGLTITAERQAQLAKAALKSGVAFVLFDWMYHYVTDEQPMNLNTFLRYFDAEERKRLMFLDGITKSLGYIEHPQLSPDRIRGGDQVYRRARVAYGDAILPLCIAMAAYEMGYEKASQSIVDPTNASRKVLKKFLDEHNFTYILGKGYYAFIQVGNWIRRRLG